MTMDTEDCPALPSLTWRQLEILLQDEAASPLQAIMAGHMVSGLRSHARFLTLSGRLREVAIIILAVTDPLSQEAEMPSAP
jgi:hypothetical protein